MADWIKKAAEDKAYLNTDRDIWRAAPGDYYADRIFVTEGEGIGLDVGGHCIVKPIREWFKLAQKASTNPGVIARNVPQPQILVPQGSAPEFSELKEYTKLRMLAQMATEAPCFTNAILAVTDAYREGWADSTKTDRT